MLHPRIHETNREGRMMQYERIVSAALSETRSKFALAEALALDVPPEMGRDAQTHQRVAEARQAIIDAGGEPRDVATLLEYRLTAQWVRSAETSPHFRWVSGYSYSAHNQARRGGGRYDDFAAHPRTVEEIRRDRGQASADGPPAAQVRNWTPGQKSEALREILSDPEQQDAALREILPDPGQKAEVVRDWLADDDGGRVRAEVGRVVHQHDADTEQHLSSVRQSRVNEGERPDFETTESVMRVLADVGQLETDIAALPGHLSDRSKSLLSYAFGKLKATVDYYASVDHEHGLDDEELARFFGARS